jgi:hypothetical protein
MFKAIKRIGKDKLKFVVDFSALALKITSQEDFNLKLQLQRGDQKPEDLPVMRVQASRQEQ